MSIITKWATINKKLEEYPETGGFGAGRDWDYLKNNYFKVERDGADDDGDEDERTWAIVPFGSKYDSYIVRERELTFKKKAIVIVV